MPTLVWIRRPESGADASREKSAATRKEAAVPDPVVSTAAVPDSVISVSAFPDPAVSSDVALPASSSKPTADGHKKRKHGLNPAEAAVKKKKSKASSERDLPIGVVKTLSGKFRSSIRWGGKQRNIGTFDTPEQASAAYVSARKDLDGAKLSGFGADEVDAIFDAAQKKALKTVGVCVRKKTLPPGVYKTLAGKFQSSICWGGKRRNIVLSK